MANEKNLRPVASHDEAVERGRAGGIKSAENRQRRKTLRAIAQTLADEAIIISKPDGSHVSVTYDIALVATQYRKAITEGDTHAARFIAELLGELKMNVALEGGGVVINVKNDEERALIEDITERKQ